MRHRLNRILDHPVQWVIGLLERHLGVPDGLQHLRWMARVARPLAFKLVSVARVSAYRRALPADAFFVASLTATASEDCGHCLAMGRHAALQAGVDRRVVAACTGGEGMALSPQLKAVRSFARAVIAHDEPEADAQRQALRQQFGEEGLAELVMAIALARVLPTVRRGAGFEDSCELIDVPATSAITSPRQAVR